jgi:hypothetical protein
VALVPVALPLPAPVADVDPLAVDPPAAEPLPVPLAPAVPVVPDPVVPEPVVLPDPDICIRHPVAVTLPLPLPLCPVLPALPALLCAEPSAAVIQMPMTAAPLPMNFRFMVVSSTCRVF